MCTTLCRPELELDMEHLFTTVQIGHLQLVRKLVPRHFSKKDYTVHISGSVNASISVMVKIELNV